MFEVALDYDLRGPDVSIHLPRVQTWTSIYYIEVHGTDISRTAEIRILRTST